MAWQKFLTAIDNEYTNSGITASMLTYSEADRRTILPRETVDYVFNQARCALAEGGLQGTSLGLFVDTADVAMNEEGDEQEGDQVMLMTTQEINNQRRSELEL